jgi:16S rRNA (uracil1498-N3)-methyltransferase
MTRRRWIADEFSGNSAALVGSHARHLAQVLRAQIGQEFEISVNGELRAGRVSRVLPDRVEFALGDPVSHETGVEITVALAIFKFDRMEWAIEKSTELGVARIVPIIAARTEKHLASAAVKRVERWRRIAREASEQSRRVSVPQVADPLAFKELFGLNSGTKLVLSEVEESLRLKDAVLAGSESVAMAFGPEGGWRGQELEAFHAAGWTAASLGKAILRAETAVVAAVSIASSLL